MMSKRSIIAAAHEVAKSDWARAEERYDEALSLFRTVQAQSICVARIAKRGDGKYGIIMPTGDCEYATEFSDSWSLLELDELHAWAHDMLDEQPE